MTQLAEDPSIHGWWGMLSLAAVLAVVVFCYPLLLGVPLLDPDEGLHASIAQEMVERGDWLTPRFLGQPFRDKPILYFWAQALSLRWLGASEATVRLPGLAFGLLGAITTGLIAGQMFNRHLALLAGMFYATTVVPTALAQAAAHDVALVPWVNLAVLLLWKSTQATMSPRPKRRALAAYTVGVGLVLGLAMLTKGLAGLALVAVAYGSYLLVSGRLSWAACLRGVAAVGIATAIAAPWYIVMEIGNPGYLHYYFIERHLLGFAAESQIHGAEPWWYYVPILLGGGLPWISYLPVTIYDSWLRRCSAGTAEGLGIRDWGLAIPNPRTLIPNPQSPTPVLFLWCWLLGGMLLVSLAHSKMVTYLWPVFPAPVILSAMAWQRLLKGTLSEGARRLFGWIFLGSSLAAPAVLAIVLYVVQRQYLVSLGSSAWTITLLTGAVAWLPPVFWLAGRTRATLTLSVLCTATQFVAIVTLVLPPLADAASARDLAQHFNRLGRIPSRLLIAESRLGSLVFYLDRNLRTRLQEGQLQQVQIDKLDASDSGAMVVLPERKLRRAERLVDLNGLAYESIGHYRLYRAADVVSRLPAAAADFQRCSQNSKHRVNGPIFNSALATTQPTAAPHSTSLSQCALDSIR